jgi:hypothetical protein
MPGLKHQSIVQILRDEPQLVTMFLGRSGFRLPSGAMPGIVDSDLSHRDPGMLKELLSDNVFLYKGMETGFTFLPFVSGHGCLPPPGGPFFGPELTMLHVLTGTLDLSIHEARMFALATIAEAQPDRYRRYVHLIRIFTPRHARKELEQLMEDLFKDPFIDRFIEEGKQLGIERGMQQGMEQGMQQGMEQGMQQGMEQGKRLGRADGAARVLVTILAARGIAIADQVRARIAECTDPDLLERWATRAAISTTIDEVFAS